jgi:hypothetical protein
MKHLKLFRLIFFCSVVDVKIVSSLGMLDITCVCNTENSTSVRLINISSVKSIQIIDKKNLIA